MIEKMGSILTQREIQIEPQRKRFNTEAQRHEGTEGREKKADKDLTQRREDAKGGDRKGNLTTETQRKKRKTEITQRKRGINCL